MGAIDRTHGTWTGSGAISGGTLGKCRTVQSGADAFLAAQIGLQRAGHGHATILILI